MARTQFEKFDTDGSGYIEEHEVINFVRGRLEDC
jgi:Ca2+-binding EF-hand superfamily protein